MIQYIVFLRGINVGGHKKFPKVSQLEILAKLGCQNPKVYLHTGNWTFQSKETKEVIEVRISEAIKKSYDWEVPVVVKTVEEITQILKACPFPSGKKEKSYFSLLKEVPSNEDIAIMNAVSYPNEQFFVTETCIYFYPEFGAGKAKLNNNVFENKLKVAATTRNYNTLFKIHSLASV